MSSPSSSIVPSALATSTRLCRALDLQVSIPTPDRVDIRLNGETIYCPSAALTVLDVFAYPLALAEGVERTSAQLRGAMEWMEISALVVELARQGVLVDEAGQRPSLESRSSFGAPPIHAQMLNDTQRTAAYLRAIGEVVRPGDVVLDLGTGTGVLATAAAQAGAARVYAIEATTIGEAATTVFAANGVADRVMLVPGWSTKVELPERVDVMVSEIIGNDPLGESVREMTWDARRRFLKPGARMIPSALSVMAQAVHVPAAFIDQHTFSPRNTAAWKERYGIDFEPLVDAQLATVTKVYIKPHVARDWARIGQPVAVADFPMERIEWVGLRKELELEADADGEITGVVEYFSAQLSAGVTLADDPWSVDDHCNWHVRVWLLPRPIVVRRGDAFRVRYQHSNPGERDSIVVTGAGA